MKYNAKAEAALERVGDILERDDKRDDGLIRRISNLEIRSIDEKARTVEVVASSEAIDSYDEIVLQDWDLSRYEKNPTVLYLHNSGGGFCGPSTKDTFPVGFSTNVRLEGGKLLAVLNFVDEKASPLAPFCWEGFRQGSIRAVSVGFRPRDIKPGKLDGKDVYYLSGNELFEISVVPIGANPDAVALSHKRNLALLRQRVAKTEKRKMNEEEIKALREKVAALEAEASKYKAASESAAETAAKKVSELTEKLAAESAAKLAVVSELTEEKAARAEEKTKHETALAAEKKRADDEESKAQALEVKFLIGRKIDPSEEEDMVALRKENPARFASMMSKRADKKLTESVVSADPKPQSKSVQKSDAPDLIAIGTR